MQSSTHIRTHLVPTISKDVQTKDVHIEMNGESIAILTCEEPKRKIPAIRLKTVDAKNDWANVLALVVYKNAMFKFDLKNCKAVYLIRDQSQENPLLDRWKTHVKKYRLKNIEEGLNNSIETTKDAILDQLSDLAIGVEQANKSIKHLFALSNRNGNITATHELGLVPKKNEKDLDSYEIDD